MNEIKIFNNAEFGQIRTVEISGKIYFVASDVAKALGYEKPANAVAMHCRYTLKRGISHPQSPDKQIEVNVIPEGDMYRLITHSKLESAERFETWVFDEVLPTIRQTGSYNMPKKKLSPLELMELQFQALKEVDGKVDAVDRDLQQFKQDMPILGIEESRITAAVRKKGVNCLGGKDSEAYSDRSLRSKVYADIYGQLKREFGVDTYKAIKRSQSDLAVEIVEAYELPIFLSEQIDDLNCKTEFDEMLM